jgi:hypothetical protein
MDPVPEILDALHPEAAGLVRCRGGDFVAELAGVIRAHQEVVGLRPVDADAGAAQGAAVVAGQPLVVVEPDRAGVDEHGQLHVARDGSRQGRQVHAGFQRHQDALVRVSLSFRVGPDGAHPAQFHLFRDVQVLGGQLAIDRCVHREGAGTEPLRPIGTEGDLVVMPVGAGRDVVQRAYRRRLDIELTGRPCDEVRAGPAAAPAVAVIAEQAGHQHA